MSTTIDQKIVEMKFDNRDFERNAKTSMSTLDKLKEKLNFKSASKGLEELQNASNRLNFDETYNGINRVIPQFNAFYSIANRIFERLTDKAINLVKSMSIDQVTAGMAKYEQEVSSVQTIMAATGKDIEFVSEQVERLSWFSDETSYSFSDMIDNVGKFTSSGVELESAVTAMQGIANWAAISGQNTNAAARAMYNLSQALGVGSVKAIDWKSIENANMATKDFKENALEAAAAVGTLIEKADGKYILASQEKAFKKASKNQKENWKYITALNFRDSLKDDWFNAEVLKRVLTEYGAYGEAVKSVQEALSETGKELTASGTMRYIENIFGANNQGKTAENIAKIAKELNITNEEATALVSTYNSVGRAAFKAAQEAKTWGDAVNATKDAVSSQFMLMFKNIFGDYQDAKVLFTDMANEMWEVFAGPLEAFNEQLGNALYHKGSWKELIDQFNELGISAEDYQKKLLEQNKEFKVTIGEEEYSLQQLIEKFGSLEKVTERGYLTTEQLTGAFEAFGKQAGEVEEGTNTIAENIALIAEKGGRIKLIESFGNLYKYVKGIAGIISDSFKNFFGSIQSSKIVEIIDKFHDFTESLDPLEEGSESVRKLSTGFDGLFSIFRAFSKLVGTLITPVKELAKIALPILKELFLDIFEKAGNIIKKVSDTLSEIFDDIRQNTVDFFKDVTGSEAYKNVEKFVEKIKKALGDLANTIEQYVGNIDIKKTAQNILHFVGGILGVVNAVLTSPTVTTFIGKVADSIKKLWDTIKQIKLPTFKEVWEGIQNFFKSFAGFFPSFNLNFASIKEFFKFLKETLVAKFNWDKNSFFNKIVDLYSNENSTLRKAINWLSGIFTSVKNLIKNTAKISFDELVLAGKKLGELAVLFASFKALFSLSKLFDALADKVSGKETLGQKMASIIDFLKVMAVVVAEAAAIIYVFSKLTKEEIRQGLDGFAGMLVILIGAVALINKASKDNSVLKNTSSAWNLVAFAIVLKAIGDVLMDMQDYKFNLGSIFGIYAVMGGLILAMKQLGGLENIASAAAILSFVTALNLMLNVIENYAKFDWKNNMSGVFALAIMMGALVVIIRKLNDVSGVASKIQIVGLVIALKLLVGIVAELGAIKSSTLRKGLAVLTGIGLVLSGLYALLSWINTKFGGNAFKGIDAKFGAFMGVVTLLIACAAIIVILGNMPQDALIQGGAAVTILMGLVTGMMLAMKGLANTTLAGMGAIIATLAGMTTVLVAIGYLFGFLLNDKYKKSDIAVIAGVIVGIVGVLSLLMGAMAKYVPMLAVIPLAMYAKAAAAVSGMTLIFAATAGLIAYVAAGFAYAEESLKKGVVVAELVGKIVGSLVGGLIGGVLQGTASSFPKIAEYLSSFMQNLGPFLDAFKGDNAIESGKVSEFVNAISSLGKNLKTMTGNMIYMDRLPTLAEKLGKFVKSLVDNQFFSLLSNVNDNEAKAVEVLGSIIEAFGDLPSDNGITKFWSGTTDYSVFEQGGGFDKYINALIRFISGVKEVNVTDKVKQKIQDLIGVSGDVNTLITSLPKINGIKQAWEGSTDFTMFNDDGTFTQYITGLRKMISSLGMFRIDQTSKDAISEFVTTVQLITGVTSGLDNVQNNFWEEAIGKKKLADYAEQLDDFVFNMKDVFTHIKEVRDSFTFFEIRSSFKQMLSLADVFDDINTDSVIAQFKDLVTGVVKNYAGIINAELDSYSKEIKDKGKEMAKNVIDGFANTFSDPITTKKITLAAKQLGEAFVTKFNFVMKIASPSRVMAEAGQFTVAGFVNEINSSLNLVNRAGANVGNATLDGLRSALSDSNRLLDTNRGELSPVISPVVDLTNVKRGGQQISSMLEDSPMYDLVSNRGMNLSSSINIQNGSTGVVGAINDLQNKFDTLLDGIRGMNVVMDSGALVGSISTDMDKALGTISTYKGRGNA